MYYIYGQSGPSLLIESTDSMITSIKKQLQKIERKVGMERIQTRVVRMLTKVKGRPYFYLSSVFGCLFTSHLKVFLSSLFK